MRVQCCLTVIQQFTTDAEYKAIRARVCQWDSGDAEKNAKLAEVQRRVWAGRT
jgi:hypothetical protein